MQNKDLVSCCLPYSANAKTAILQYLNCKSKVNVKKDNFANAEDVLCVSRLLHLLRAYAPTQSLFSGNTLATVSAEPLNKFGLFDVLSFIDGDLYALVYQKVELCSTTQLSATSSLLALCQITFSQLCLLILLLIGFPKYQKFESKNKNIDWFKSFTNLSHL